MLSRVIVTIPYSLCSVYVWLAAFRANYGYWTSSRWFHEASASAGHGDTPRRYVLFSHAPAMLSVLYWFLIPKEAMSAGDGETTVLLGSAMIALVWCALVLLLHASLVWPIRRSLRFGLLTGTIFFAAWYPLFMFIVDNADWNNVNVFTSFSAFVAILGLPGALVVDPLWRFWRAHITGAHPSDTWNMFEATGIVAVGVVSSILYGVVGWLGGCIAAQVRRGKAGESSKSPNRKEEDDR